MLYWIFVLFKKKASSCCFVTRKEDWVLHWDSRVNIKIKYTVYPISMFTNWLKFLDYGHDAAQNWSLFYLPHFVPLLCDEGVCEDLNTSLYGAIG